MSITPDPFEQARANLEAAGALAPDDPSLDIPPGAVDLAALKTLAMNPDAIPTVMNIEFTSFNWKWMMEHHSDGVTPRNMRLVFWTTLLPMVKFNVPFEIDNAGLFGDQTVDAVKQVKAMLNAPDNGSTETTVEDGISTPD